MTSAVESVVFTTDQGAKLSFSAVGPRVGVKLQVNAFLTVTHTVSPADARRMATMAGYAANDAEAAALAAAKVPK